MPVPETYAGKVTKADFIDVAELLNDVETPPTVAARRTTTLSVSSGAWTAITFNSEDEDALGFHDTSTNSERLTVPAGQGGLYLAVGVVSFDANATGSRFARILKNALTDGAQVAITALPNAGTFRTRVAVTALVRLAAADWIAMQGYQNSGSSNDVGSPSGTVYETVFAMTRLGA